MIKSDSLETLHEELAIGENPLKAALIDLECERKNESIPEVDRSLADITNTSPKAAQMTPQKLLKTLASLPPSRESLSPPPNFQLTPKRAPARFQSFRPASDDSCDESSQSLTDTIPKRAVDSPLVVAELLKFYDTPVKESTLFSAQDSSMNFNLMNEITSNIGDMQPEQFIDDVSTIKELKEKVSEAEMQHKVLSKNYSAAEMSLRDIDPLSDNQDIVHTEIRTRKQFIEKELGELTQLRDQLKKMMAKEENLEKEIEQLVCKKMMKKDKEMKKEKEETDKEDEEEMKSSFVDSDVKRSSDGGLLASLLFIGLAIISLFVAVGFVHYNQRDLYRMIMNLMKNGMEAAGFYTSTY